MATHSTAEPATQASEAQLWTVRKGDRRIDCRLHVRDDRPEAETVELRVLRDGVWCAGGRFTATADALAHGEELLMGLQSTGWVITDDR